MTAPRYRLDGNTRLDARKTPGWPTLRPPTLGAPPGGPLTLLPISEGRLSLESTDWTMGSLRLPPWLAVGPRGGVRSEEHTSELQSLMRMSYAAFCVQEKQTSD